MQPEQVGVPVITLIGTIGRDRTVCQTYPPLRSSSGNTFAAPDPFSSGLPSAFDGAAHYVEVRFFDGKNARGLIAVEKDLSEKALKFFSFNVAIHRRPTAIALYRFTDSSYPNLTPQSETELLYLRPIDLPPDDPLAGLSPLMKVGRGWLGDFSNVVLDRFCTTSEECSSDAFSIEWRSKIGSYSIVYASSLAAEPLQLWGASIFPLPVIHDRDDSAEYNITVLATRFYNDGLGLAPLLTTDPPSDEGSSDIDATHGIRLVAPWEMNGSLPAGTYHSIPDVMQLSAEAVDVSGSKSHLINLSISLNLHTVTEAPTFSPTKKPSPGPSRSPVIVRYYIDWNSFTCVTDGESTEWAPPHVSKEDCCYAHMAYDFPLCMSNSDR